MMKSFSVPPICFLLLSLVLTESRKPLRRGNDRLLQYPRDERHQGQPKDVERNACYVLTNHSSNNNKNTDGTTTNKRMTLKYFYELEYDKDSDPNAIVAKVKTSIRKAVGVSIATNSCETEENDVKIQISNDDSLDILKG